MSNDNSDGPTIYISGMTWLRLFSAGQVMSLPSRMLGVTHKRARQVIRETLGYCPKGKPGKGKDAIVAWLGVEVVEDDATPVDVSA
jgi:hypothetical protein